MTAQPWEYRTTTEQVPLSEEALCRLGMQGWELVTMLPLLRWKHTALDSDGFHYVFKRQRGRPE